MNMKLFAVYDSKAGLYNNPVYFRSVPEAVRSFSSAAKDPQSGDLMQHPADFTFFHIGEFDQETGRIDQLAAFTNLGTALEHQGEPQQ